MKNYNLIQWVERELNDGVLFNYDLADIQIDYLLDDSRLKAYVSGRRCGKQTIIESDVLYQATHNANEHFLIIAKYESSLRLMRSEIKRFLTIKSLYDGESRSGKTIHLTNGCIIEFYTMSNKTIVDFNSFNRGRSFKAVYIDEAGYIDFLPEIIDSILPTLFAGNGTLNLLGTPKPGDAKFAFSLLNHNFSIYRANVYNIHEYDIASGIAQEFSAVLSDDQYDSQVLGKFK